MYLFLRFSKFFLSSFQGTFIVSQTFNILCLSLNLYGVSYFNIFTIKQPN